MAKWIRVAAAAVVSLMLVLLFGDVLTAYYRPMGGGDRPAGAVSLAGVSGTAGPWDAVRGAGRVFLPVQPDRGYRFYPPVLYG